MQKTKKAKLLSIILCIFMLAALFPTSALAAGQEPSNGGEITERTFTGEGYGDLEKANEASGARARSAAADELFAEDLNSTLSKYAGKENDFLSKNSSAVLSAADEFKAALENPIGMSGFDEDFDADSNEKVRVIVQLTTAPAAMLEDGVLNQKVMNEVESSHNVFRGELRSAGISASATILYEYSVVVNGYAIELPAKDVEALAAMPSVFSVSPETMVYATSAGEEPDEWAGKGMLESRELFGMDEINYELGFTGKGVVVGVLDTGIDYNHPDLADAYIGGYDFVNNDNDPMETTYEDWKKTSQPLVDSRNSYYYTAHGSHVSGTIAARGVSDATFSTKGIAPEASIRAYKVLGPYGSGPNSGVIAGIERSVQDGCDVINLSLGGGSNNAYAADSTAVNAAALAGVVVCLSAGNDGADGFGSITDPGTAYLPITVGNGFAGGKNVEGYNNITLNAGENIATVAVELTGQDYNNSFADDTINGTSLVKTANGYEFVAIPGYGEEADFVGLGLEKGDLEGKIAVIKRGEIDFTTKRANAEAYGAGAVIIVNNQPGHLTSTTLHGEQVGVIPTFSATQEMGAAIYSFYDAAQGPAFMNLGAFSSVSKPNVLSPDSSQGAANPLYGIKPDVTAPGTDIMSTVPSFSTMPDYDDEAYEYGYARYSGTSMSSPHVAGVAALLVEAFPEADTGEIKARLMNTANPDMDEPTSVFQMGAGLINPMAALTTDVYITVNDEVPYRENNQNILLADQAMGSFNFGILEAGGSKTLTMTIFNLAGGEIEADISTYFHGTTVPYAGDAAANGITVNASKSKVSVEASTDVDVTIDIPEAAAEGGYEGFVRVAVGDNFYTLPFAVSVGAPAGGGQVIESFVSRPMVSNNVETRDDYSGSTNIWFSHTGFSVGATTAAYDPFTGRLLGILGEKQYAAQEVVGDNYIRVFGMVSGQVIPYDYDTGTFGSEWVNLPDGLYACETLVDFEDGSYEQVFSGFYVVDSKAPKVTFDQEDQVIEYPASTKQFTITGNIYSEGVALIEYYGIPYGLYETEPVFGQESNRLLIGNTYYGTGVNGNFSMIITADETSKDTVGTLEFQGADFVAQDDILLLGFIPYTIWKSNNISPVYTARFIEAATVESVVVDNNFNYDVATATVTLSKKPYNAPTAEDFAALLNNEALGIENFSYDGERTVTFTFPAIMPVVGAEQPYSLSVTYKESTATFDGVVAPDSRATVTAKEEEKYTRAVEGGYTMISFKLYDEDKIVGFKLNDGAYNALTPNKNSDINYIKVGGSLKGAKVGENILTVYDALGNEAVYRFTLVS